MFTSIATTVGHNKVDPPIGYSSQGTCLQQDQLSAIRQRLDRDLPKGPYITDEQFSQLIHVSLKTLANARAGEQKRNRYPLPFTFSGCRKGMHVRENIVEWLAQEELSASKRTVHRCR